jgi:guanosine-3',5'-bis(diphosphate) 3'-pyrophosphohydrolase
MKDPLDDLIVLEAASFAARAHKEQLRKDGETPYASHVFRVCLVVRHLFGFDDARMLAAALLHDTIEDTTTDFDDITAVFGPEIADWVASLSKDKRLRDEDRERDYMRRLCAAPWEVQVCKLAEMYDNLMDSRNLDETRRQHSLARAEQYLEALKSSESAQTTGPLRVVEALLAALREPA